MTKKLTILLLAIIAAFTTVTAQTAAVRWRSTAKMTSATEGVLTVKAIIADGWHLYGTQIPEGGPVATSFDFKASTGLKFTGPFVQSVKPISKEDPTFGMTLSFWEKSVTFTRKFKLTGPFDKALINGQIRYMACNDQNCMPPKTESVKIQPKAL